MFFQIPFLLEQRNKVIELIKNNLIDLASEIKKGKITVLQVS